MNVAAELKLDAKLAEKAEIPIISVRRCAETAGNIQQSSSTTFAPQLRPNSENGTGLAHLSSAEDVAVFALLQETKQLAVSAAGDINSGVKRDGSTNLKFEL